jgi:mono/diheme cytochrome c family protein
MRRTVTLVLVLGALTLGAIAVTARGVPALPAVDQITARAPDLEHGRYVATLSDCAYCHTAPGGPAYGGGRALPTPLGAIYSTNVTPDRDNGIGGYDFADFLRLMRHGVAPGGKWLYPAMPFTAYARMSDDDLWDLFSYLQQKVAGSQRRNDRPGIPWPLTWRAPLALWTKSFHHAKPYVTDASQDATWNRGAYLVQGPAHCGSCHTPRNWLMAEQSDLFLSGTGFDGGSPINLRGNDGDGLGRWSEQDVVDSLKNGRNPHSAVSGSMIDVVGASTQYFSDEDLHAIARYLKSLPAADDAGRGQFAANDVSLSRVMNGQESSEGGLIFMDSCAACHRLAGRGAAEVFPGLAGNPMVLAKDPASLITVILIGSRLPSTAERPSPLAMPGFAWRYSDEEIAALASYVRGSWGNSASPVTASQVAALRRHWL